MNKDRSYEFGLDFCNDKRLGGPFRMGMFANSQAYSVADLIKEDGGEGLRGTSEILGRGDECIFDECLD